MTYRYSPDDDSDRLFAVFTDDIESLAPLKTWCKSMKIKTVALSEHVLQAACEIEIIRHLTPGFYFLGLPCPWHIGDHTEMKGFIWFPKGGDLLITEFMLRGEQYE